MSLDPVSIQSIFSSDSFHQHSESLLKLLHQYFHNSQNEIQSVNAYLKPEESIKFWRNYSENNEPGKIFADVLHKSLKLHHPKYVGHQVCPPAPLASLAQWFASSINNGGAVYEMGMSIVGIEKESVQFFAQKIGYKNGGGFFTSGGTLANMTALLTARKIKSNYDVWEDGYSQKLGIMVSAQSHYCVERAARIMGMGSAGVIKIPVTDQYVMDVNALEPYYKKAKEDGIQIIAIVASAPSTSTGKYDDISRIASFAKKNNLWLHIDGAHGGPAIISKKNKSLLKGIEHADSIIIDTHKMMMCPSLSTVVLYKNEAHAFRTFQTEADYLWDDQTDLDWTNLGKCTFECTKSMIALPFYVLWKNYGENIFAQNIDYLYSLCNEFYTYLNGHPNFDVVVKPDSNILCFRYNQIKDNLSLNEINKSIRKTIVENNQFYLVQTVLNDQVWLRVSIMNANTKLSHLKELASLICETAKNLI